MKKFLLPLLFLTVLLVHNVDAQSPSISYPSPQTLYIGEQVTPIVVKNTGGTIPNNLYPQDISITNSSFSLFGAGAFIMNSTGDLFIIIGSQIFRFRPDGTSSVFAGNPQWGTIDGTGTNAGFQEMTGIAIDAADNLYVAESNPYDGANSKIRKITPAAVVTTYASGLNGPNGITVASSGIIYVSTYTNQILKIASDGSSSVLAGKTGGGNADGIGANASFSYPSQLVTDKSGNIYLNDFENSRIRKITPDGTVTTFAGSTYGSADGIGTAASFFNPTDIAIDSKQNLIIADGNGLVRKITPSAVVTTIAQPPYYDNQNNVTYPNYPSTFALDKNDNIISYTQNGFYKLLITGYSISPALPAGLIFGTDGSISGTPSVLSSQQSYTVRAQNSSGLSSTNITLQVVIPPKPPVVDSFSPISAPIGGEVIISGKYFTGTTAVTIGGQPVSSYYILSPTSISANVGTGATSGDVTVTNSYGTGSLSGFTLIPPPVITSFTPTSGGNGSVITITGTGFTGVNEVLIGGYYASFKVISPTQIQATVGSTGATGSIDIYSPNGSATLTGFTYISPPSISSISPVNGGPGTTVTINGSNFSNATAVSFGTTPASSFTVVSSSQITAVVASGSSSGVSVTTPGGTTSYSGFSYIPPPVITQVNPLTGGAGSIIYITGSNLLGAQVTIGGVPATVGYSYSSAQITVTVGSGASGDIDVVTSSGSASFPGFIWVPAPVITSFSPQTAGLGDKVTITGTNFTGANSVFFGGVPAQFTVVSPTTIQATVGYGASGAVTVSSAGGSGSLNGFVDLAPTITSFSPTQGGAGTIVTIHGTNFTGATAVAFGGVPATSFTVNSATQITATVGQGKSGSVTVTSPEGTGILAGFVHPGPSISYFSPGYAGPLSTSPIIITGTNFTGATSVTFGGVPAASFTVLSSTSISAVAANAASGDVVVTTPSGSDKSSGFIWVQPPTISSIAPASQKNGGMVTISGTNFTGVTSVKFGGTPAAAFFASSTTTIAAYIGNGTSGDVTVSTVGGTATISGFTYISPVIQSVSPLVAAAGQTVTITGLNLDSVKTVQFGGVNATSVSVVSSGKVTAVVGTGASGYVTVTGPLGSGSFAGFTFVSPPVIYGISPNQGGAGTVVSISGANLATVTGVNIGGVPATISSTSDNLVKATVGTGATGMISLTTIAGTAQFDGFTWFPAPTITSATPLTAGAPTTVTITGTNFTGVTQVSFGGIVVGFTIVSPTQITVQPLYAASGNITVTGPGGTASLPGFVFIPAPVITGFSTTGDGQSDVVTISGSNFDNASAVLFGGIAAQSFTVVSSNSITAKPGTGATGPITITTPGGTGTFAGFLYQKPPSITSFSPAIGPIGTTVTITGNNFNLTAEKNVVFFGPVKAKVVSATQTQLQVIAPAGANGLITVSNIDKGLSASSNLPFLITNSSGYTGFSNKFSLQFSSPVSSYLVEDFDGDGQPDLLIAKDDSIFILRHGSNPVLNAASFSQKIILETGRQSAGMVVGDLDGDGKMDILYNIGLSLAVLHNTSTNGNISFEQTIIEDIDGRDYSQMVLRDIDMDGRPDLITGSGVIYPNTTTGSVISFGPLAFLANTDASSNISFTLTDLDGDNKPDPILGSSYTGFSIFQNATVPGSIAPTLFPLTYILHNGYYYAASTMLSADIDGDNKPDIIENDFSQSQFLVTRNTSVKGTINTSSVAQPLAYPNSAFFDGMQLADIDGDGKIDLVGITNANISWTRNTSSIGNISFGNNTQLIAIPSGYNSQSVSAYDMDGDGRMDLVVLDGNTNKLTIYNNGPVTVPQITAVTPLTAGTGATITITGKYFTGTTAVNFGSKAASSFKVISADTITAVVGAGESGNITLQNPNGAATFPGFKFIPPPVLTSAIAASNGSGKLTITGSNLSTATTVTLAGNAAASFTATSDTSITAVFNTATGILSVTTIGGTATLPNITVTNNTPTIISLSSSTAISGATITLTGINFSGVTGVSFGGTPATSFTVNSATSITAVVGNGTSGNVSVTSPTGTGTLGGFNFVPVPTITAGGPTTILSDGPGVVLTANPGTGFSYQWLNNGVNISGATNATYTATESGLYTVKISLNGLTQGSAGTTVASVFQLPPANFQLTITSETCYGSSDGFIKIKAQQALNYTATITGNGLNKSYAFTDTTTINNLAAGTYSVCITVAGQSDYESCYNVTLTQPQPLSVYATVNSSAKSVDLALSGGSEYLVELNGTLYKTTDNKITLPLIAGNNKLKVTTDKLCQGSFEKLINANGTISVYPVPFQNTINVDIGNTNINKVMIKIYDTEFGKLVYTNQFINQSGVLQLDVSNLRIGVYGLYIILDNVQSFFKIIK